ncbi:MAG: hypothetical protein GY922_15890 [Proteobacteria bacterium]|nr:hypothetical protein [Pseudomonadota bacterium]
MSFTAKRRLNWTPSRRKKTAWQVAPWLMVPGGVGQGFLFLLAKMIQNSVDDGLIFNTRYDPDRSTASVTDLDVYSSG